MERRAFLRNVVGAAALSLAGCTGSYSTSGKGSSGSTTTQSAGSKNSSTGKSSTSTTAPSSGNESKGKSTVEKRSTDKYGDILVNSDGMSLYMFAPDSSQKSTCYGNCANAWPPLTSDSPTTGDGVTGKIDTIARKDGSEQVTITGHPLYLYTADQQPGDMNGQGIDSFGGKWFLLNPNGSKVESKQSSTTSSGGGY